ncbi:hypothetical protein LTR36_000267 [Oleoguttula mirabilis]|uniref:Uncharacterized protein n=1 Tax=Oleoguttula mirabilis TaxID=1507867 RepID=A0AAV9JYN8_9PEZI|nr:hypothetical protein LTR36_000267 [Oleoguttula mirabilis]
MAAGDLFFSRLPPELRDWVYDELVEQDFAIILPHTFDTVSGGAGVPQPTPQNNTGLKTSIISINVSLNSVSKQFRSEYNARLTKRTLDLQIGGISAFVLNLQFDNLVDGFLGRLSTAAETAPSPDLLIDVSFCFDKDYKEHLIDLNQHDTSLGRWLKYRDQTEADGKQVDLQYAIGRIKLRNQESIRWVIDIYKRFGYRDKESVEMDQVVRLFREHFEQNVRYEDVTPRETNDDSAEEDEDEDGAADHDGDDSG